MKIEKLSSKIKYLTNIESFLLAITISYLAIFWVIYIDNRNAMTLGYLFLLIAILINYFIVRKFIFKNNEENSISFLPFALTIGIMGLYLIFNSIYYIQKYYTEYIFGEGDINYHFISWNQNIWIISYILPFAILISYLLQVILLKKLRKTNRRMSFIESLKNTLKLIGKLFLIWLLSFIIILSVFTFYNLSGPAPFG